MKTYKVMAAELDELLQELQSDGLDIDEAVKVYEKATKLIGKMEAHLDSSEIRITKLKANIDSSS